MPLECARSNVPLDHRNDLLPPLLAWNSNDDHAPDPFHVRQDSLDLDGVDVLATRDDDVVRPTEYREPAVDELAHI